MVRSIMKFYHYRKTHPRHYNDVADALSRFQIDRFRQLAPGAALNPCQCPPPSDVMWY